MKSKSLFVRTFAVSIGITAAFAGLANADECKAIGTRVAKAVTEEPTKVLVVVDDAISENSACACEIVKAAISASDADKQLVREIVVTAATAAPDMAASVAECAVAEAPEAASQIKAALNEVFAGAKGGGKSVVYDDGYSAKGGKGVVIEEDVEEDFGPEPVVISGVYLIAPSASSSRGFGRVDDAEIERQNRLIEILRRRASSTRDSRGRGTTSSGPTEVDMAAMDYDDSQGGSTGSETISSEITNVGGGGGVEVVAIGGDEGDAVGDAAVDVAQESAE